jgi:hypothetical protein
VTVVSLALGLGGKLCLVLDGRLLDGLEVALGQHRASRSGARLGVGGRMVLALEMRRDIAGE